MKKILLIAAMAFATVAGFAQTKFAHVNFQELVILMPEAEAARAQMNATSQEAQETYQGMMDEFQAKYQQYQQKSSTWTPTIRESKEKELTDMQNRIAEFSQSIQAELAEQEQALMAPLYQKAQDAVSKLAKDGGYTYVMDKGSFLYVDEANSVDLTPAARKALKIADGRTLETLQAELMAQAQQQTQ